MSRLIMNYLLFKEGFTFFKYISLEKVILENKSDYLLKLKTINSRWNTLNYDYSGLITWFLEIFNISLNNYINMFNLSALYYEHKINKAQLIINAIDVINKTK